jgi:5,10-methylenetetrahydromethanopterin reductase
MAGDKFLKRFGISFLGNSPVKDMVKYARLAEKNCFESAWVAEGYFRRDALSSIMAVALATKKMKLGIGCINPYTRNPALIAMSIATIDECSNKRLILGLGASSRHWIEYQMDIPQKSPVTCIRECVEIIRRLLTGKTITYEGSAFKIREVNLGFKPVRDAIPIYLASVGPRMLQLAGEIADGVLLSWGTSIEYVKYAVQNIKIGAKRVRRDPAKIDVASNIIFSVDQNSKSAKDIVKPIVMQVLKNSEAECLLKRCGLEQYINVLGSIRKAVRKGDFALAAEYVPDAVVEALTISGKPRDCEEKLEKYRKAGITLPVVVPFGNIPTAIQTIR